MEKITITEALAEIKTIDKRIEKKTGFIMGYIAHQEGVRDPLAKDGGSAKVISREMQAIADLQVRMLELRRGIQRANERTEITVEGKTLSIADWLVWRRDVAPRQRQVLAQLQAQLNSLRQQARSKGQTLVSATAITADTQPTDIVVNIDEAAIARDSEQIENILGTLDGQLSLKNATVTIE